MPKSPAKKNVVPTLPSVPVRITGFIAHSDAIRLLPELTNVQSWDTSRSQIDLHLYDNQLLKVLELLSKE